MSKKLKILYHHRVAAQDGQSVHITELTNSFRALGHELIFVGPTLQPKEFGQQNKFLAFIRKILPGFAQELLELAYGYRAYRKLAAAYRQHQPDILYERHNLFLPAGKILKEKTGIPYLLEVNAPLAEERAEHSGLHLKALAVKLEVATWQAADMTFPVTNVLADKLRTKGVQDDAITILHNGINHADYEGVDQQKIRQKFGLEGKVVLGFTGFLREWHKLDRIISLLAKFDPTDSPHLLVVGDGPAVESCQQLARQLNVQDRIHFAGFAKRAEIFEYLTAMDIALQPAVTAYASPLKLFEYMRSELAIVAPDQPNIREILTDGENALLFNPAKPEAAEEQILRLIQDPALRKKLGSAAQRSINTHTYTWLDNAKRISQIAESLLK
ncbi:MAG: glycosyltransferase family 4 protein [Kordiimonadaceae bacterium]|nr:glycosyltransferase family 4 protein [Kordiimonadaceae bacterium]